MIDRVLGLETEYAPFYDPGPGGDAGTIAGRGLYDLIAAEVLARRPSVPSCGRKPGRSLANGSFIHFETIHQPGGAPPASGLFEWATPECRTAREVVAYQRAAEEDMEEAIAAVNGRGCAGHIRILANNRDARGNAYGSHENLWVEDRTGPFVVAARAAIFAAYWTLALLVYIPIVTAVVLVAISVLALGLAGGVVARVPGLRPAGRGLVSSLRRLVGDVDGEGSPLVRCLAGVEKGLVWPLFRAYRAAARHLVLRRIADPLAAFLATRVVWCGAGRVTWTGGASGFSLSQRADLTTTVKDAFLNTPARPMIDVKDALAFGTPRVFARMRRLHVMCGDTNLADTAVYLRLGVTALLVRMAEEGALAAAPRLADPVATFRAASLDPTLTMTPAIAVQRAYLGLARAFYGAGADPETVRVLDRWEETLAAMESDPALARRRVDWLAKKDLLDAFLVSRWTTWEEEEAWGRAFETGVAPPAGDAGRHRETWQGLMRIDLGYHELGPEGYHRRLRRAGLVDREVGEAEVERARTSPPVGTRAAVRGRFVEVAAGRPGAAADWDRVRVDAHAWRSWVMRLADPLNGDPSRLDGMPPTPTR